MSDTPSNDKRKWSVAAYVAIILWGVRLVFDFGTWWGLIQSEKYADGKDAEVRLEVNAVRNELISSFGVLHSDIIVLKEALLIDVVKSDAAKEKLRGIGTDQAPVFPQNKTNHKQ